MSNVPAVGSEWVGRRQGGLYRVSRVPAPEGAAPGPEHCTADRVAMREVAPDAATPLGPEMGVDLRTFHRHYLPARGPAPEPAPPPAFKPGMVVKLRSNEELRATLCHKAGEDWRVVYVPPWGTAGKICVALVPEVALELVRPCPEAGPETETD